MIKTYRCVEYNFAIDIRVGHFKETVEFTGLFLPNLLQKLRTAICKAKVEFNPET